MSDAAFGEQLKREREMRGVSLEEVSKATRIGVRFLEAIEAGRWEQLPGGVFNRGFIRAIGRFLGLDEDNLIAEYAMETKDAPRVSVLDKRLQQTARAPIAGVAVVVLLLVAAGYFAVRHGGPHVREWARSRWNGQKREALNASQNPPAPLPIAHPADSHPATGAAASMPGVAPRPAPIIPPAGGQPTPATGGGTDLPPINQPAVADNKPGVTTPGQASGATVAAGAAPATNDGAKNATPLGDAARNEAASDFVLALRMHSPSHVIVTQDGYRMLDKTLDAGETRTYFGKQQYDVTVEDAGAIAVTLNGKSIPFPAGAAGATPHLTLRRTGAAPAETSNPN
jgi:cytoskeletal protein RodZ